MEMASCLTFCSMTLFVQSQIAVASQQQFTYGHKLDFRGVRKRELLFPVSLEYFFLGNISYLHIRIKFLKLIAVHERNSECYSSSFFYIMDATSLL